MSAQSKNIPSPTWLDRNIFPYQGRQIRILNHDMHYVDEGQGLTLLLLHGNGSWSFGFRLVIPALSAHFRVIALDYPGFGLSTAQPGFSFKPRDHSNVVEAFVEALNLRDIHLFVEDWGGRIGLGFAGRRPELIHLLIITNTWAWPAQDTPQLRRFSFLAGSFLGRF
jgi:haloalkane dehalogenase